MPGTGAGGVELDRLARAHYRVIGALYGCETTPVTAPGAPSDVAPVAGHWVRSRFIEDAEWNHLGGIDDGAAADPAGPSVPPTRLIELARATAPADRRPALALTSRRDHGPVREALEREGWTVAYRHAWLVHPGGAVATPDLGPGVDIRAVGGGSELDAFLRVFADVFTPEDEDDAAAYGAALRASAAPGVGEARVTHYLATVDGEPAGIASAVAVDGVCGGFNLGVLPAYRGRGLGGALTRTRLRDALRAGCDLNYLLTEDPAVEASQLRRGYRRVMTSEGWTESS